MNNIRLTVLMLNISLLCAFWAILTSPITAQGQQGWQVYAQDSVVRDLAVIDQEIWAATNQGVLRLNLADNSQTLYTTADGLADNNTHDITVDKAGHVWVATEQALTRFDGLTWVPLLTDELQGNQVTVLTSDQSGNIWLGLDRLSANQGQGARQFLQNIPAESSPAPWTVYTFEDGLAHNYVNAMAVDQEGTVWFGTASGASRFDGQSWTTYKAEEGLAHNWINAIIIDPSGRQWFGTEGGGVSVFDGANWATYTAADGLASNVVRALAADQAGRIWAGTNGGVSQYNGSAWINYTRQAGLLSNQVNAIVIDPDGNAWFATNKGLTRFDETGWTTSALSLPDIKAIPAPATSSDSIEITGPRFIDAEAGRMYARGQVKGIEKTLVLSMTNEALLATYDLAGNLALDPANGWLYIDQKEAGLAVINTQTGRLQTMISLPGGPDYPGPAPQPDPASGQVLVFRDNVTYIANPETGLIIDTIASDIVETTHCTAGLRAQVPPIGYARYDRQARILYTGFNMFSCSSTAGINYSYQTISYDMATKTELARDQAPRFGGTALYGYFYQPRYYYIGGWRDGDRLIWRDGYPWFLSQGWVDSGGVIDFDPGRQLFYEVTDASLRVFEADTMALTIHLTKPITGTFERYDATRDELQFRGADSLLRAWPAGNIRSPDPAPLITSSVPTTPLKSWTISPNWPEDPTLFGIWHDPLTVDQRMTTDPCDTPGNGQLYISSNGGREWGRSLNGIQGSCEMFTTLAVSPDYARDQTLLAGVVGLGIFKSTDGGRLWLPSGAGLTQMTLQEILFSPGFAGDQTAFARSPQQLYRSIDGGQSWAPIRDSRLENVTLSPEFDQDRVVAGTITEAAHNRTGLYISRDRGDGWELAGYLPGVAVTKLSLAPLFARWQILFASGQTDSNQHRLLVSRDGGRNWETALTLNAPAAQIIYGPDIEQNRPIFLLAGGGLYRSDNGGQSWITIELPADLPPFKLAISPNFAQDRELYLITIAGQVITMMQ